MRLKFSAFTFSLYDDKNNITETEAKQILQMYTHHHDDITAYEAKYGVGLDGRLEGNNVIDNANNDYHLSGSDQVDTLAEALKPARDMLVGLYVNQKNIAVDINGEVLVGDYALDLYDQLTGRDETNPPIPQAPLPSNDLLIGGEGDDGLKGLAGDDVLYGDAGDDLLDGGIGSDSLQGGDGYDTYRTDSGDTVLDSDGQGEVWLAGKQLHGGDKKSGEDHWTADDGTTYRLFGSRLIVSGGGDIVVNQFTNHDLGIHLTETDKPLGGKGIVSPIILDLNGDGIATTTVQNGAYFDHDHNGFAEHSGWVNRQDGLLAWDRDNNGRIDSGRELFGSQTLLADGQLATNGYAALAELDGNGDGQIDAQDPAYTTLRIWQDRNGDGSSQANEQLSLAAAQVQSLATAYTATDLTDNGNRILQTGTYTKTDGSIGNNADIWFQSDDRNTIPAQQLSETPEVAALPNLPGFRQVYDLHQAMLRDGTGHLQALVQQFVDAPAADRFALIDPLIFAWLGVENVPARGSFINEHKLFALETFTGEHFIQGFGTNAGTENPGPNAAAYLTGLYGELAQTVYQQLMDSHFAALLDTVLFTWNTATNQFDCDTTGTVAGLQSLYGQGAESLWEINEFASTLKRHGILGEKTLTALHQQGDRLGAGFVGVLGRLGYSNQIGDDNNNIQLGSQDNDLFLGMAGNDQLYGNSGNDELDGGTGNDMLEGGQGNDRYTFHLGDGQDTVFDFDAALGNQDIILFAAGIAQSDISLGRNCYDLVIKINSTADQVTVQNFGGSPEYRIEKINFADGTNWNVADLYAPFAGLPIIGSANNDQLVAWWDENGIIQGMGGDDTLYGNTGNDTLEGGTGTDSLIGGVGNDTYLFNSGDGQDIISDSDYDKNNIDTIQLGAGIIASEVNLNRNGYDLVLNIGNSTDQLVLKGFGSGNSNHIEQLRFFDGTTWNLDTLFIGQPFVGNNGNDSIRAWFDYDCMLYGLEGNDMLIGANGNDTLAGDTGADILLGGIGNDTYLLNSGDGQDLIIEDDSNSANIDTIRFGTGIAPNSITLVRNGYDLVLTINGTTDQLTIQNFGDSILRQIEQVTFADGTLWDTAKLANLIARTPALGGNTDDSFTAWLNRDSTLIGMAGNDTLYGNTGNDILDGGVGADTLLGGIGNDTYLFNSGDGQDSISDSDYDKNNIDTIQLGAGIIASEVNLNRNGYDLVLNIGNSTDQLVLKGFGSGNSNHIEQLRFFDGTTWNLDTLFIGQPFVGNNGNDSIRAWFDYDCTLYGLEGNDVLIGANGNDTLVGGAGNDIMRGVTGNDYYFATDGDNILELSNCGEDTIERDYDTIYLLENNVENLVLAGTVFQGNGNDLDNIITGNFTANYLWGGKGNDTLIGGTGNDYLVGDGGNDVYMFNRGDGQDSIDNTDLLAATDTLRFGAGIANTDVVAFQYGNDVVLKIKGGTDQVAFSNYYGADTVNGNAVSDHKIDHVEFANGVVWDQAALQLQVDRTNNNHAPVINTYLPTLVAPTGLFFTYTLAAGTITDPDTYDSVTYSMTQADGSALPPWLNFDADTRTFSGTPDTGSIGSLQLRLTGTDNYGGSSSENVTLDFATPLNLSGSAGADSLYGGYGNDVLNGMAGDDHLYGGQGDDTLIGGAGRDALIGNEGLDTLIGGTDDDYYEVDNVTDTIIESADEGIDNVRSTVSYTLAANVEGLSADGTANLELIGNALDNGLWGNTGNNTLVGLAGNDYIIGGEGADTLIGGAGNDYYETDNIADTVIEAADEGSDFIRSTVSYTLVANVENLDLDGTANLYATGNGLNNWLWGNTGNNTLAGLAGDDHLAGNGGNDLYMFNRGDGQDSIDNTDLLAATDTLRFGVGIANTDVVAFQYGNDVVLKIKGGTDQVAFSNYFGADTVNGNSVSDHKIDRVEFANGVVWDQTGLQVQVDRTNNNHAPVINTYLPTLVAPTGLFFTYTLAADTITDPDTYDSVTYSMTQADGSALPAWLNFDASTRTFSGTPDTGSIGSLQLRLTGTDNYGGSSSENISLDFATPLVLNGDASANWLYGGYGNDVLNGMAGDDYLFGHQGDDTLVGGDGRDVMDGDAGADMLIGGTGDDYYEVDNIGDTVLESANEGNDEVRSTISYTLPDNVENLNMDGMADLYATGNGLDNWLSGNSGNNTLTGLAGNDYLFGHQGDDTLVGGDGRDVMDGDAGADMLIGGTGDDYYEVDNIGDTVLESANEGSDEVHSTINYALPENLERLTADGLADLSISGNALDNGLWGNIGNNTLAGLAGNDYLVGRGGNDVYIFNPGDGQDYIDNTDLLSATDTLRFGAGIANTDVLAFQFGNDLYLKIKGSTDQIGFSNYYGADTVDGNVVSDHKIDRVEFANGVVWGQTDLQVQVDRGVYNHVPVINTFLPTLHSLVGSFFSYTVPIGTITDPDPWDTIRYNATLPDGSALPAWLSFDAASRTLSGTPGLNEAGSLSFLLWGTDNYNSSICESVTLNIAPPNRAPVLSTPLADQSAPQGAAFSYTLPTTAFTDPDAGDTLSYSAILADGSTLPAWLTFNPATRLFSGTPSALGTTSILVTATDTSGLGVSDAFDIVVSIQNLTLNGTSATDTLIGGFGNDTLNGQAGNDTLVGNAGNDTLNGGTGNDVMQGGLGDDSYLVDSGTDSITENLNEGLDSVQSSVSYVLANQVENLLLTGTTAINGTGNTLDNVLTGNSAANTLTGGAGNDRLDGKAGADKMLGGLGDDIYVVDKSTDTITENANEGMDSVESSITLTLAANLENLLLTGSSAINGTGNTLNNLLTGNSAANSLGGAAGNDILDGKGGTDTLTGGLGNDVYLLGRGYGNDTIIDNDSSAGNSDTVQFLTGITAAQIWFSRPAASNNLKLDIIGTADSFVIKDWYLGTATHAEQFKTIDGTRLLTDGNVQNLVNAMAAFTPPNLGQTTLPDNYLTVLAPIIDSNWLVY